MALGAGHADVRRLGLQSGLMTIGVGVMIGLVASAGLARLMGSLLFEVHRLDPLTYGAAAAGVTVVAVLASLAPVRRAVSVDPVVTLGAE
jgi:ABC-type antimicrobial peptide transport system permease subunit